MDKVEAAKAYRWLSPGDPFEKHILFKSLRSPGTLKWLVDSPQFQRWLNDEQQVLLCTGNPASGKTVATSIVVDTLLEKFGSNEEIGIAFLYHTYDQEDQNLERLLRSVLYQLGYRLPLIPTALVDLYRRYNNGASLPSVQELLRIISETISKMSKVYLVIDALDELKSSHRRVLLSGLFGLQESLHVSLFATSRHIPDIVNRFQQFPSLEIGGAVVEHDLDAFITQSMERLPKFVLRHPDLQAQVRETVTAGSHGTILAAKVLLDELATAQSPESLSRKLSDLPVSLQLHEIYAAMMSRIERMVPEDKTLAKMALAWLLFARRPLKEAEFQHALGIEEGLSELDNDKIPDTIQIVALCKGFVTVTGTAKIWYLTHPTTAEYLRATQNDWFPEAKAMVAKYCLTYLAFDEFGQGYCKTDEEFEARLRENPLYEYAAQYWVDHLRDTPDLPERAITSFLIDQGKVASASQAMQLSEHESREQGYSQKFDHKQTGLHLAAQFGLESVIDLLLVAGQKPAVRDSKGLTPLWRATGESHEAVIRLLSRVDRTTFTVMLAEQKFSLAYSLLRHAGQTVKDTRLRTALHLGVIHNAPELIQNALKYGVDINAKDGDAYSPLQLAIQYQYGQGIDLLLSNSASTKHITASSWLQAYNRPASDIVELSECSGGRKQIQFFSTDHFDWKAHRVSHDRKQMIMLPDLTAWHVVHSADSSTGEELLSWKLSAVDVLSVDERVLRHSILALFPVRTSPKEDKLFSYVLKGIRIAWTITTWTDLSGKDQWMTLDYLSTLQSGSMPESGMAFFNELVNALMTAWVEICDCIDGHLTLCRPDVLNANGKQTTLINRLLDDANTWITLRHQLRKQVETARTFRKHYLKFADGNEAVGLLDRTIEMFAERVALRIDKFDAASSALIQLEFNLTSIREAQKSTTLNRSIKRLTWITFVFLPLIFVSGLFGMNVNILARNPPWWWYVVFMLGTLCLTMAVWVAFKRHPELEDKFEDKFGWLVKPRRPKGQFKDVEKGWVADRKEKDV